ncbi:MAG: choice-of-anchor D domain-containing protein, partial [Acidobacteriia bacterium]|nr:choice-of-anchor D domain-containing protein [Terriglobia bacterium]
MKGFKTALRKFVFCLSLFLVVAGIFLRSASAQTKPNIMTWGQNVSSWNTSLGVTAMREGCSIYPTQCEPWLDNVANLSGAKTYYVSFPFDPSTSVAWAKEYSTLSLSHKMMVEIGFDDFVNKIENDQIAGTLPNPAAFVSDVIAAAKSANPNLAFGVTIYEDSLTHAALTNAVLPAALRAEIGYVHLYVHYRENAPNYASYVATAKSIFPNARIIAGAYPYDRMDYLPCAYQGTVHCTWSQEQSLYKELLQSQSSLLKQGTIYGLEFFFGYFGDPQDWPSWTSSTRICTPSRLPTCYENSAVLQNITLDVLRATFTGTVSLSHTGLAMGSEVVNQSTTPTTVTMTNSGTGALAITNIGVGGLNSADFPLTRNCPTSLAAGASCTMTVSFKPLATGARDAQIVITDGAGTQYVTLTGTGLAATSGTPAVSLPHTSVYMGSEYVNTLSTPFLLVMTNSGTGSLLINSISVTGTNGNNFPLTQNCPASLAAGAKCTLTIYFKPTATGTRTGSIVITDNAGSGSQTVTLTGTALSAGTPVVSLPYTSVYMGSEFVNTLSTPFLLVMTNSGTGSLSISSITVGGTNGNNFPLTQNCPASLAVGAKCTLTIY